MAVALTTVANATERPTARTDLMNSTVVCSSSSSSSSSNGINGNSTGSCCCWQGSRIRSVRILFLSVSLYFSKRGAY